MQNVSTTNVSSRLTPSADPEQSFRPAGPPPVTSGAVVTIGRRFANGNELFAVTAGAPSSTAPPRSSTMLDGLMAERVVMGSKAVLAAIAAVLSVALVASDARADIARLKNGGEVRGSFLSDPSSKTPLSMETILGGRIVLPAESVTSTSRRSAEVEDYVTRSRSIPNTVEAHWELAEWCKATAAHEPARRAARGTARTRSHSRGGPSRTRPHALPGPVDDPR